MKMADVLRQLADKIEQSEGGSPTAQAWKDAAKTAKSK